MLIRGSGASGYLAVIGVGHIMQRKWGLKNDLMGESGSRSRWWAA